MAQVPIPDDRVRDPWERNPGNDGMGESQSASI